MTRATQSISLSLISSSLILAGCGRTPDTSDTRRSTGHRSGHGGIFIPLTGGGSTAAPSGGSSSAGATTRGGFGSTGATATSGGS
jgi:hypothetical protein